MFNIRDYLPDKELNVGEQIHVHHCTDGKNNDRLYIKRTNDGYLYYCHHCGLHGSVSEGKSRYSKATQRHRVHSTNTTGDINSSRGSSKTARLPRDSSGRVEEWPARARVWVYSGGLTDLEIQQYGFVYSEYYDRVWFPVYNNKVIRAVVGRRLKNDNSPKYLIYKEKEFNNLWYANPKNSDTVCIVEDVLSAIRCSRFVAGAALLGTNLPDSAIQFLIRRHKKFIIFMDDDNSKVKMKQVHLKNKLELIGSVKLITKIGKDPKELTDKELEALL